MSEMVIFEGEAGQLEVRLEGESPWLTQEQMAGLFAVQKAAISKHLKNIYLSSELTREATVSKMETVRNEGMRQVTRSLEHFNLDAVISVGYRVNSARATRFRQWATRVLREHLTRGYTLRVVANHTCGPHLNLDRSMNKSELIAAIAASADLPKTTATAALDAFMAAITGALQQGESVTLVGFGTFEVKRRTAREGRNPQTGAAVQIAAAKVPGFKPGKNLKATLD